MTCDDALEALLEADPTVLEGIGEEPLARHLRKCAACARKALAIRQGEASLAAALERALPAPDLEVILAAAGVDSSGPAIPLPAPQRSRAVSTKVLALFPMAAAAAVAALLLTRPPALPGPVYSPPPPAPGLDVRTPAGSSVAVLETNNPDITVLWLF